MRNETFLFSLAFLLGLILTVGCSNNEGITGTDIGANGSNLTDGENGNNDDQEEEEKDRDKEDQDEFQEEDWNHYSCKCGGEGEEGARRRDRIAQLIKEAKVTVTQARVTQGVSSRQVLTASKVIDLVKLESELNGLLTQLAIPATQRSGEIRLTVANANYKVKLSDDSERSLILPSVSRRGIVIQFRRDSNVVTGKISLDATCNFRINGDGNTVAGIKRVLFVPNVNSILK